MAPLRAQAHSTAQKDNAQAETLCFFGPTQAETLSKNICRRMEGIGPSIEGRGPIAEEKAANAIWGKGVSESGQPNEPD